MNLLNRKVKTLELVLGDPNSFTSRKSRFSWNISAIVDVLHFFEGMLKLKMFVSFVLDKNVLLGFNRLSAFSLLSIAGFSGR